MSVLKGIIVAIASFFLLSFLVVGCIVYMAVPKADHNLAGKQTGTASNAKAITEHWSPSKDGKALFATNPRSFANKLVHAKKFLFEFDPFNTPSTADLNFNIDGLQAALSSQPDCVGSRNR